jgi:DNA-binding NarL/FixJ family response regulator
MPVLHGRETELATIEGLLEKARNGHGAALVVRGVTGIGKTALVDQVVEHAGDMAVVRCAGIEAEAELPYAGVQLLLRSYADRLPELPAPQAAALRAVFGLAGAPPSDPFMIGLGTLSLLALAAEDRPVLCVVDDAHWLDRPSANALLVAGRRVRNEGIVLILLAREEVSALPVAGVPELRLGGLGHRASAAMLAECAGDLAPPVRDRIIEESGGNPLALIELSHALRSSRLSGELPAARHIGTLLESVQVKTPYSERLTGLPERARFALLVAAAEDEGDLAVVTGALRHLGGSLDDLEAAEHARLVQLTHSRIVFEHPLIRATVYQEAAASRRLAVHHALADTLNRRGESERATWHLAMATTEPDAQVAGRLVGLAQRAAERGRHAAAAAAYERAAELSGDGPGRARWFVVAAMEAGTAGRMRWANMLADRAAALADEPMVMAWLARVRAWIEFEQGSPRVAGELLLTGARRIAGSAPGTAAAMLAEAAGSAYFNGDRRTVELAAEALSGLSLPADRQVRCLAVQGLAAILGGDLGSGVSVLRTAVTEVLNMGDLRFGLRHNAAVWSLVAGCDEAVRELSHALVRECRAHGLVGPLPHALQLLAQAEAFRGANASARANGLEALQLAQDTEQTHRAGHVSGVLARLAAIEGDEQACRELSAAGSVRDNAPADDWKVCSLALLDLSMLRPESALTRLEEVVKGHTSVAISSLPDYVEAAAAAGRPQAAREALGRFTEFAEHAGQPWATAVALRCRALLSSGEETDRLFAQAVQEHRRGGRPFERARTELLYGEWLRRARRRTEAVSRFRSALCVFEQLGARPWVDRTRGELRAAGGRIAPENPTADPLGRLTPQELQVVRLAARGLSNRDIGAQLFLSPRTVGYHLYKAYPKLGVAKRADLAGLVFGADGV